MAERVEQNQTISRERESVENRLGSVSSSIVTSYLWLGLLLQKRLKLPWWMFSHILWLSSLSGLKRQRPAHLHWRWQQPCLPNRKLGECRGPRAEGYHSWEVPQRQKRKLIKVILKSGFWCRDLWLLFNPISSPEEAGRTQSNDSWYTLCSTPTFSSHPFKIIIRRSIIYMYSEHTIY